MTADCGMKPENLCGNEIAQAGDCCKFRKYSDAQVLFNCNEFEP